MNKKKLIELRCRAWGITEDEYYCNQCSDFSLEDMARAYRRGKNKGRAGLKEGLVVGSMLNRHLNSQNKALEEERDKYRNMVFDKDERLTKAMKHLKDLVYVVELGKNELATARILAEAKEFLKEE